MLRIKKLLFKKILKQLVLIIVYITSILDNKYTFISVIQMCSIKKPRLHSFKNS